MWFRDDKRNKIAKHDPEHPAAHANGHRHDASSITGVTSRGAADAAIADVHEDAAVAGGGAEQFPVSPGSSRTPVLSAPRYFMDSVHEAERLERKTDPHIVGQHLLTSGLGLGMRALDVACGSGSVTRMMAHIAGSHLVTGVDASEDRLNYARLQAGYEQLDVAFKRGTAEELPFPDGHFDYTHARFLFQYLKQPERVLSEMIRVTRPGGLVVVADLDNQLDALYPVSVEVREQLHQALAILAMQGFDPLVGRKLYKMFCDANLCDVRIWVEPHQLYYGGLQPRDRDNWEQKMATATKFLGRSTGEFEHWEAFRRSYLEQLFAPDAFYYSTHVLTTGRVPT